MKRVLPLLILILGLMAFMVLSLGIPKEVLANLTAKLCDQPEQKYRCSEVSYSSSGSGWQIGARRYWGGYGINSPGATSGADQWKLWLARDWQYINGAWQKKWQCTDCAAWHTLPRPGLEGPFTIGPTGSNAIRIFNTSVQFQHQYYQIQANRVFCQGIEEHYLSNGTSYYRSELTVCNY